MKVFQELRKNLGQKDKWICVVDLTHAIVMHMTHSTPIQQAGNLVILDIENMVGTPDPTPEDVQRIIDRLVEVIEDFEVVPCVVACSHFAAPVVMFAFPRALKRLRSGPNGADLALLDEMGDHRVVDRYQKITLCSGDGIFTDEVARLGRAGVEVTVIANEGTLAARLRLAAAQVITMPLEVELEPAAAMKEAS